MIGEVLAFDSAEVTKRAKDYPVEVSPEIAAKFKGRPVIFATNVINTASTDLALRLPPPMTAEELALRKAMKAIAPASAALRADADKMDANLAKEHAAALKQAFAQTEAIWKAKGKADAVQIAADARKLAETIELDAAAAKWDEVKTSAGTLNTKCGACHGVYRERFDDGSFRIKGAPDRHEVVPCLITTPASRRRWRRIPTARCSTTSPTSHAHRSGQPPPCCSRARRCPGAPSSS